MILLTARDITKYYGPDAVLAGATFDLRAGERAALVGPNGAGKTTLLKIITGQEQPDSGVVEIGGGARIGLLQQHPDFAPDQTVLDIARSALDELLGLVKRSEQLADKIATTQEEDVRRRLEQQFDVLQHQLQQHDVYNVDHRIERVLEGLGFAESTHQQKVTQLSGGQQNRLLLVQLLLAEPEIMLLDEPSNHLDIDATEWLENYLISSRQAVLVVSHDRYFLDKVTTRTLELHQGTVESFPGNFTQYKRLKAERLEVQRRTYERQQEEIARMEDFIRKNFAGQNHAQAEDRRKKLERIERVAPPREIKSPPMKFPDATRTGDIVCRIEGLSKSFDRPLFQNLSLDILRGEKWGILGPNGCGKTTLLRVLLGQVKADSGKWTLGSGVRIAYFDQMLSHLDPECEVVDAVRPDHKEFITQQRRDLLARFGLADDIVFQKVKSLSGGERNRTALALLAASDPNFLILDEPTNHLDLWARGALEKALQEFDGSVLFVSHDRYFLNQVATKLLVVEPGRFRVIDGNYDTWQHLVREGLAKEARAATSAASKGGGSSSSSSKVEESTSRGDAKKPKRKRQYPYRKVSDIEGEIAERESSVEALQQQLALPEVLRDGPRVKQVMQEIETHQEAIAKLYDHWEEASELN